MSEKEGGFIIVDNNGNSLNLEHENLENVCTNTVMLPGEENKMKCFEELNKNKKKRKLWKTNNGESNSIYNEVPKEQFSAYTKVSTRRVPNILKNNMKLHTATKTAPNETNSGFNHINSPSKRNCIKREGERSSHRRKQEHSFMDVWQEKEKSLFPKSHDISTEFIPEFDVSSLQETEPKNLQDSIDFSSNEIFSKFNYELCGVNNMSDFTDYTTDLNETCNSSITIYDSSIYEKKLDVNDNEIDICKTFQSSLMNIKHNEEDVSTAQYSTTSEYWANYLSQLNDENPNCSSDLCCGYCLEDYTFHRVVSSGANTSTTMKNKVLSETIDGNSVTKNNDINYQNNCDCSSSYITKADVCSTAATLTEEYSANSSYLLTIDSKVCPQNVLENTESSFTESIISSNEEDTKKEIFKEPIAVKEKEYNTSNELSSDPFFESRVDSVFQKSEDSMEFQYHTDALQTQMFAEDNTIGEEFQCLLCPLTFSSTRTMAIHQAGAHGGTYIILCESCGRLFNRKYHFNRHFIHCGRLKEPYRCDMCMKKYRHKSSLVHHLKLTHHVHYARNHSTTFTCSICKKIYSKFGAFENHMKRHKNKW
ncbi:PREDICTED: asparagine-rich zinc finger protein AZF1-like [Dufourea novaeangliae]|uniref:asparagine-rich zinc finger protein AZF1-like n=1 Tax=Dufourea novaeangliae TaxID=178035 RepID=UPI000767C27C|nr:PREDICTED: asparagine-rich zinc finger protein AZF1-like [Dufourea novaeangliae]